MLDATDVSPTMGLRPPIEDTVLLTILLIDAVLLAMLLLLHLPILGCISQYSLILLFLLYFLSHELLYNEEPLAFITLISS